MSADTRRHAIAETISATRRIPASPDTVFAVLANPAAHADMHSHSRVNEAVDALRIGQVRGAVDTERITRAGQRFRMAMYHEQHPNKNYETINEVLLYVPSSAIVWRTGYLDEDGVAQFGGWLWRYDLVPTDGSATDASPTDVTLTYDWSAATQNARAIIDFPPFGPEHLHNSLVNLTALVAPTNE